jgi:hypothetical protein
LMPPVVVATDLGTGAGTGLHHHHLPL